MPLSEYWLVVVVNIAVPFGIQILVRALGVDLLNADRDPLTGLLNRRAFYERASQLVAAHGLHGFTPRGGDDRSRPVQAAQRHEGHAAATAY